MRRSTINHQCHTTSLISYWVGRILLSILGWKVEGEVPPGCKFVLVGAPHTSNWDFPIGLATLYVFRLHVTWVGKDTLFKWPFGGFMRWLGGIGVDRSHPAGVADHLANRIKDAQSMVLVITPSGTRGKREYWKSGFYRIALAADVPLLCGALDYQSKTARLGLSFKPTGDLKSDMDRIRDYYKDMSAAYPENATPIRLREEDDLPLPNKDS
ncbi:lysophospholipid acyltransferase family protein [Sedimenticola selenatireducens]|jgi:1-acyl-sn-glycerol-3-phosphate acyltransferase|uniref:Acyltransferase n=1 Tax=Sedimenticola selenatireducens TaxID=191960 RepID=A0A557SHR2_9GAMM|nr:lysophospholipid acyltransferase family protein [Sedimenticola selenatireducens]TVO76945.1 acyltransferase [Sedimenticola selenatireducens]TVT64388.1 MAG: acyltransferase [Sedimenticola selenatireducens]